MNTNKQIQLLEKLTDKKVVLKENDFFKQHILSKEEKLERRLNSIKGILIKGGTYKDGLDLTNTPIDSLYNLERVEGSLHLRNTQIKDLGNLEKVGGYLDLENTPIESLGKLEYVGGYLYLKNIQIKDLGKLEYVGGYLYLKNIQIKDLGKLEHVRGWIYLNKNTPLYHNKELIEEYKRKGFKFNIS